MPSRVTEASAAALPVAVVGASTSGLLTAIRLAETGRSVRVFERSPSAEVAQRTLIVTDELLEVAGDVAAGAVTNRIDAFEIVAGARRLEIPLSRPDLVIERATLLADLAARAEAVGVDVRWGTPFAGLETRGEQLMMIAGGDGNPFTETRVQTLVGADGMTSRVAATLRWPRPARLSLIQAIVALPAGMPSNVSTVWFQPERTPYFFWLVPESPERAAVGLISEDARSARRVLDDFLVDEGFRPLEYQAARIPGYERWIPPHRKVGAADVYLVGDAAGHVKVTTVGGIVNGFRGATAVADAVVNGYSRRVFRPLRRELDAHLRIRNVLHGLGESGYETLLELFDDGLTRRIGRTNRDRPVRMLARAVAAQPRLVTFAAAAIARRAFAPARPRTEPVVTSQPRVAWAMDTAANDHLESAR